MIKYRDRMLGRATVLAAGLAIALSSGNTYAESLFDGCPSKPILQRFVEFGKTGKMPPELGKWLNTPADQKIPPWKPFDNVEFVGICWVSSWLVHTDDGSVLIDTLYGPHTSQLIENLKATGVDTDNIKYVLMTHGHRDHAGGAVALKPLLPNAKFVMSQKGWDEAQESAEKSSGRRAWKMLETDIVLKDGEFIELGSNKFRLVETPGHTWGTSSYLYDVIDGEQSYRAVTIGGLGLNAIEGPAQVESYIASVDHLRSLVEGENLEVHLSTHGFSNNLDEDRQKHLSRKDGDANVFVNPEGLLQQISSLRAGAVDRLAKENAKKN